jgi:pimeloyl-ACP methyl ester carboxylesterase
LTGWVLLRGLTREAGHWGDFAHQLSDALGGAPVHLMDLPGAGARHADRSPADVAAIADACQAELSRRGLPMPVRLLGLSMGGMVSAAWSLRHPASVSALVLVNTSFGGLSPPWQRMRVACWPTVARAALGWTGASVEEIVLHLTSAQPSRHAEVLNHWRALRTRHPVGTMNAARQLLAAARWHVPDHAPAVPTLVIASTGDRLVDPACARAIARHWSLPLRQHPWAGHDLPLDDGAWLADQVASWAAGLVDGAA